MDVTRGAESGDVISSMFTVHDQLNVIDLDVSMKAIPRLTMNQLDPTDLFETEKLWKTLENALRNTRQKIPTGLNHQNFFKQFGIPTEN